MPQDVDNGVIRANFEEGIIRSVPAIKHLLNNPQMIVEPKTEGAFVRLPPRITLHPHPHIDIRGTEALSVSIQVILSPSPPQNSRPAPPHESETQPRNLRDLRVTDLNYFYSLKTH
jgi:hypothetical protein